MQLTDAARHPRPGATGALAFTNFVAGLVQTIVIAVQGELPAMLEAPRSLTAWVVTATVMVGAALSPVIGRLGDLHSRKKVLAIVMGLCVLGSVIGGVADSAWGVIVGRGLQGVAIAAIPLGISILKEVAPPASLGRGIAIVSGGLAAGSALGLPLGALIAGGLGDWIAGFWVCGALSVIALGWIVLYVPDARIPDGETADDGSHTPGRFDAVGAVLVVIGTSGLIVGLSQGLTRGWTSAFTLTALILGTLAGCAAWIHMWRTQDPLLDLRASMRRPVLLTNLAAALLNFALMASFVALPQIMSLQPGGGVGLGLSVFAASLIMTANGLATVAATPLIGWLTTRWGPRATLILGGAVVTAQLALTLPASGNSWLLLALNIFLGVGFGLCFAGAPQLIMASVAARDVGAANGLNAQLRIFGTAAAGAVAGAILAASDRAADGLPGPGLQAFQILFLVAAGAAAAGMIFAIGIPRTTKQCDA